MTATQKTEKSQPLLVPVAEAARILSIGKSTFWRGVAAKKLPQPVRIGGATRWRVSDLQRCIAAPASQPTSS